RLAFDSLRAEALDSKESIALIEQAANELG
ncbi:MAG: hypothetical protein JWL97_4509, partial [Gemmatimonadales bacterium]|nr:hypothetical protein [Gemmatimonadales bacterium]